MSSPLAAPLTAPRLLVDPSAIEHNVAALRPSRTALMAVVKADGFGLGARRVADAALAAGAERLGTATLGEAYELSDLGAPVLAWLTTPAELEAERDTLGASPTVEVAVGSPAHLAALTGLRAAGSTGVRVHLFADCGMSRDGCAPDDWAALCRQAALAQRAGLITCIGIMGHLGCGDHDGAECHDSGVAAFERAVRVAASYGIRPRLRHLAATSAALTAPSTHHTMVRPGAGLVGIDPARTGTLRCAATLESPLVQVRRVPAGTLVGYGHDHRTDRETWLGLLPLGYADGLPRAASGRAEVLVDGVRRPLVGLISMDQSVVDLGSTPPGDGAHVTVFGDPHVRASAPTLAEWAAWAGTLEHEILTGIGRRVRRVAPSAAASTGSFVGRVA